ncbi:MAG: hypothetical protein EGQ58_01125 [Phocaeicola dorei]|nr:hypothetical protein [Phocaeicola dorei]
MGNETFYQYDAMGHLTQSRCTGADGEEPRHHRLLLSHEQRRKACCRALRRAAAHGLPAACKGDDAGDHNARRGAAAQIPCESHRARLSRQLRRCALDRK